MLQYDELFEQSMGRSLRALGTDTRHDNRLIRQAMQPFGANEVQARRSPIQALGWPVQPQPPQLPPLFAGLLLVNGRPWTRSSRPPATSLRRREIEAIANTSIAAAAAPVALSRAPTRRVAATPHRRCQTASPARPDAAAAAAPAAAELPPEHGRHGGRADSVFPTAPHAFQPSSASTASPSLDAPQSLRLPPLAQQPSYPSHIGSPGRPPQHLAVAAAEALNPQQGHQQGHPFPSPFRSRATTAASSSSTPRRPRRLSSARLWNPTNSTPRNTQPRKRRTSTPPAPPVPLQHPTLDGFADTSGLFAAGAGDYPLLTLPQQRQTRHSPSIRASLQIERSGSHDRRVSLPRSVRASYDGSRSQLPTPGPQEVEREPFSQAFEEQAEATKAVKVDKGKGKAIMAPPNEEPRPSYSRDLERGPDVMESRPSNVSVGDGIGSALSSSNSSIMGEDVHVDAGEEWGPQHPCYPHVNPHVPIDSHEFATTRIIRIRRDWLLKGDLAPTFSNLYPEILDPAGVSEQEFRRVIEKLNGDLVLIFDPYSLRNIVDSLLGLVTGWLWDDFGLTGIKSRLNELERWINKWNLEMEKAMASEEGIIPPKIISLRQTGYMTLDIQIPDPEIAPAPSSTVAGESRTALPMEPAPAMTA
ncbi:Uncharacterized protein TPAR_01839 [Tolypocladium paradoxum]|uniref:Ras modification protein ERF4 n=1 Tax=Tolypocladium paradoxum TaxID=94208 RepID=A0A2S4L6B9_9HYPO|nr:Uncharacterized protein TPAR_01839 [Tolypocladium paradoxum]